ncbi:MAG: polynucleotide adenylyltransferase PcnB [Candidatus Endonucleobacter bathymodioli]|uniref:Poly(A) polymerase I n=1 Tax=Candidatus Endonucleibacter bathymodioli TaxID=539814 RepID=A0AA90P0Q8_9GAMM|nr:polynucleotide adenylyltransferase PcnB [Candidatus Endonucleobacter bathymodioli]
MRLSRKPRNSDNSAPPNSNFDVDPLISGASSVAVNAFKEIEPQFLIPREKHPVSRKNISDNALKVLHRLTNHGYDAYLVGGCIRDLYQGLRPKDFDVATSATPEEARRVFRNSRLIGRRFKLVHILFGRETIEVATFRASHDADEPSSDRSQHSKSGRILRDNVYGSMQDDAQRRDFTINALYYDIRDFTVTDYYDGVNDIEQKQIRLIGDPLRRYHEDPVRMLRAIRFAAKLHFNISEETAAPIHDLACLLRDIPAARLFDEVLKLLQLGQGVETFKLLREYRLLDHLLPATSECLNAQDKYVAELINQGLMSTDNRVKNNMSVTPAFLFATLLWGPMTRLARDIEKQKTPPIPAMQQAATIVLENQSGHTAIPRRFSVAIKDIWDLQIRLVRRQPRVVESLLEHQRFRAAYDFLILREASGELLDGAGQWWTDLQESTDIPQRISTLHERKHHNISKKKHYRKCRPKKPDRNF